MRLVLSMIFSGLSIHFEAKTPLYILCIVEFTDFFTRKLTNNLKILIMKKQPRRPAVKVDHVALESRMRVQEFVLGVIHDLVAHRLDR